MDDWQPGDHVALVRSSDPHTRLRPGDEGTVIGYNPLAGQLCVDWDNGSRLIMLPDVGDVVERV
jgi:hypothetical protein